jgi:hypothetical protein
MQIKDQVISFVECWRAKGHNGGWEWSERKGVVVKVNSKTVKVKRIYRDGSVSDKVIVVPMDRINLTQLEVG